MEDEKIDEKKDNNILEEAQEVLGKIEKQNEIMHKNLERAEKLAATNLLSGTTTAGQVSKESKEESPEEYKKKVMAGEL